MVDGNRRALWEATRAAGGGPTLGILQWTAPTFGRQHPPALAPAPERRPVPDPGPGCAAHYELSNICPDVDVFCAVHGWLGRMPADQARHILRTHKGTP